MRWFVYVITVLLVFFPALGFVFLKSSSRETRQAPEVRRTSILLFVLQTCSFLSLTTMFLMGNGRNGERVTLFLFLILYAVNLVAVMLIFLLPESCHADHVVERLLHTYVILFIFLFMSGVLLAPVLNLLPRY